jgi:hypothetical protein
MVSMDWIDMAQDKDRWRAVVNAVMNITVPGNAEDFLSRRKPLKFLWKGSATWS